MRADLDTGSGGATVQADTRAGGGAVGLDHPGVGAERVGRVLRRDAALQGGAADVQLVLPDPDLLQGLPSGDPQLRLHQVDVGDLLGDGVLHLDARVHLDEDVTSCPRTRCLNEELDGAGAGVVDGLGELHGVRGQRGPQLVADVWRRRDLHHLLVTALDGTVALEQVHHVALVVGEDLHLDVTGCSDRLFHEDRRITEGTLRLSHGGTQLVGEPGRVVDAPHAAAATARDRFDEHREADLLSARDQLGRVGRRWCRLEGRDSGLACLLKGPDLVAGQLQHVGGGADEGDPVGGAGGGEVWIFGQEAVPGVDRVGPGFLRDANDLADVQVGLDRMPLLPNLVGLGGLDPVIRVAVFVREDGDGLAAQLEGGTDTADCDLTTVCDKDLLKHAPRLVASLKTHRRGRQNLGMRRAQPPPLRARLSPPVWSFRASLSPAEPPRFPGRGRQTSGTRPSRGG